MLCCLFMAAVMGTFAQQMPNVPLDPNVKKGTLPNGLTYYIRHNEWPEKRVNFYIAQKVGSMQEDDDQRGLAHFLEHMCFNGTTHFPGNNLKQYLENIGVKFGENLNAYTSVDETVYNIDNVNVDIAGAIDSCLLILHDWSHDLLLEGKEIDKERGVINEEWRMRSSAMMRMYEKGFPVLYEGSKYAYRLPIGTMDVVMNFPHKAIRDYYKKWYRPDLQAVIVVGDINVDEMEQKIKDTFADIKPAPADAAVREYYPVPDNKEPIFAVLTDKEQDQSQCMIMWKDEAFPEAMKSSLQYTLVNYAINAAESMFSDRISEILQKENAPFLGAQFGYGNYMISKTKSAFQGGVVYKDDAYAPAIKALYREILRAKKFGFTASEYERFKSEYLSQVERAYNHRDKVQSVSYVNQYVRNFLDNEQAPGIEYTYQMMNQLVPNIPVDIVNQFVQQIPDSNLVIAFFCPEKEGMKYPEKDEVLSIMKEVEAENIEAYTENVSSEPILKQLPKAGKVKSIKDAEFGYKLITLSNGVKIYAKQTDFSPNQISMMGTSWGGVSLYDEKDYHTVGNADELTQLGGLGEFSATDLSKKLAGIQASAGVNIGMNSEGISGSCVKKDLETMLQLAYLRFTAPRKDQEAYNSWVQRTKASLENQELDPMTELRDTISSTLYNNNIYSKRVRPADIDAINYDRALEVYKERFADADDFVFYFVGDFQVDSLAPMLAQYLGALPTLKGSEKYKTINHHIADGVRENIFEKELQTPNAITVFVYKAPMETNLKNDILIDILGQVMGMTYTETVREDEGGAYGVPVQSNLSEYPDKEATVQIQLPTAPEKRAYMTEIVYKGVEDMVNNGPREDFLTKTKEYLIRKHDENLKSNGYWMSQMYQYTRYNHNYVDGYTDMVNSITIDDVKAIAKQIFHSGNKIAVGMTSPLNK